jgi:hypothetical protein
MDEVKSPSQGSILFQNISLQSVALLFAVVFTLDVLFKILDHWHGFGMLSKCDAVMLLMFLVVEPIAFIRAQRRGKPQAPEQLLIFAYAMVLLATITFGFRF